MAACFHIVRARTAGDIAAVARLFSKYSASLAVDLAYQGFERELAGLPGCYAPPWGELLLARSSDDEAIGCVGLRPLAPDGACEMKRLYVAPAGRGVGLGKALMLAVIEEAKRVGYREMRLDTLPTMTIAQALYCEAGFEPMEPYYETPVGTVFLRLWLANETPGKTLPRRRL